MMFGDDECCRRIQRDVTMVTNSRLGWVFGRSNREMDPIYFVIGTVWIVCVVIWIIRTIRITQNAICCTICGLPVDRIGIAANVYRRKPATSYFQCQANPKHQTGEFTSVFSDLTFTNTE